MPTDMAKGDTVATSGDAPPLAGKVETVLSAPRARAALLVTTDPCPGTAFLTAEGGDGPVAVSAYLYLHGTDEQVAEVAEAWPAFLGERFPATPEVLH